MAHTWTPTVLGQRLEEEPEKLYILLGPSIVLNALVSQLLNTLNLKAPKRVALGNPSSVDHAGCWIAKPDYARVRATAGPPAALPASFGPPGRATTSTPKIRRNRMASWAVFKGSLPLFCVRLECRYIL